MQGWIQGRSTSFSEELLQFRVPLEGAKAKVVGMATTPDNAVHVLTAHPANLYTFRGPTFDGPVQVTAMDFLPALQSGITTVPGTGELLIHSLPAGVIYKVCTHPLQGGRCIVPHPMSHRRVGVMAGRSGDDGHEAHRAA